MSAALRRPFSSLAVPNYRRYFTGQLISLSGNWMQIVAEVWLVIETGLVYELRVEDLVARLAVIERRRVGHRVL